MESFEDKIEIRNIDIKGETHWHWVKGDVGCFGEENDGPMGDWLHQHGENYYKYLRGNDVVVTGGTSCGMYARFYAKTFKQVYAFEPDPISFHCMVNNTPYENVVKLNAAIGHMNQLINIFRPDATNIGMNVIVESQPQAHIPMLTIDTLNLQACDLIQLDVEGFERQAIRGAQKTIEKFKPVIIGERFNNSNNIAFMRNLGYDLVQMSSLDAIYIPSKI